MGTLHEASGLRAYADRMQATLTTHFERNLHKTLHVDGADPIHIVGRPDALAGDVVVEHKYRAHGLIGRPRFHEIVQCHLYMWMLGLQRADIVETFQKHVSIHSIEFDQKVWTKIVDVLCKQRRNDDLT